jgi:hypothetical protein
MSIYPFFWLISDTTTWAELLAVAKNRCSGPGLAELTRFLNFGGVADYVWPLEVKLENL